MARIPYPDPSQFSDTFQKVMTDKPLNIVRMAGHSEGPAMAFLGLGRALLKDCKFNPRLRELVILRISSLSNTAYETKQHSPTARELGVTEEAIAAIGRDPDTAVFSATEKAVLRFTDDVFKHARAGHDTFNAIADVLSPQEIAELMLIIGFYMMVCRFLATLDIEIEAD